MKRDMDRLTTELNNAKKKAEELDGAQAPSRKMVSPLFRALAVVIPLAWPALLLHYVVTNFLHPHPQQVMQADLAKANEDKQALEGKLSAMEAQMDQDEKELEKLREREKKWEQESKGLLEARKVAEGDAERMKGGLARFLPSLSALTSSLEQLVLVLSIYVTRLLLPPPLPSRPLTSSLSSRSWRLKSSNSAPSSLSRRMRMVRGAFNSVACSQKLTFPLGSRIDDEALRGAGRVGMSAEFLD